MKLSTTLAALCAASFSTSAFAQDAPPLGFYGTAGLSYSVDAFNQNSVNTQTSGGVTTTSIFGSSQKGAGFQLSSGYRFSKNSAIELIYMHMPDRDSLATSITGGVTTTNSSSTASNDTLALTWLYGAPVTPAFNPFARAGVSFTYSQTTTTNSGGTYSSDQFNTGYLVGIGNDFYFTKSGYNGSALRTEVLLQNNPNSSDTGSLTFATGLVVNF